LTTERRELVERIWSRHPTVWTGKDEGRWLGWLDEPSRLREDVYPLLQLVDDVVAENEQVVLFGMGGSSLAPEVLRRAFAADRFHVLDTTHPQAIRDLQGRIDLDRTLFVSASKSGSTLETRSHTEYFWKLAPRGDQWAAITDPGSELASLAKQRDFSAVFPGEPTIGGRYSALSSFGMAPAALMGIDVARLLDRALEMVDACRGDDGNEGLELGLELGQGWQEGRDKVCVEDGSGYGFGLWVEQLIAESTGKDGKGLIPAPGEPADGPDRQRHEARLPDPYELGQEFFRWEFATAVAGAILGINPFDQPDVQAAKDKTQQILSSGEDPPLEPSGSPEELYAQAREGDYVSIQSFVNPTPEAERRLAELADGARRSTGCVVTRGFGPRYLHSTGQLHKGGPNTGLFLQVVEDYGDELKIPRKPFGFARLIRAQAAGDLESLRERGRRVARIQMEMI
jgi:transaldolase / glucose-6-phosphate isomerase